MSQNRIGLTAFGVLLGGAVWFSVPAARADSVDDAYLLTLDSYGIGYPSAGYAIATGHKVCAALYDGVPAVNVAYQIAKNSTLNMTDAAHMVGARHRCLLQRNAAWGDGMNALWLLLIPTALIEALAVIHPGEK